MLLHPIDGYGVCITDADGGNGNVHNINTRDNAFFDIVGPRYIVVRGFSFSPQVRSTHGIFQTFYLALNSCRLVTIFYIVYVCEYVMNKSGMSLIVRYAKGVYGLNNTFSLLFRTTFSGLA